MPGRCRPRYNALKIAEAAHVLEALEIPAGNRYKCFSIAGCNPRCGDELL